jgi:hypothetical protein
MARGPALLTATTAYCRDKGQATGVYYQYLTQRELCGEGAELNFYHQKGSKMALEYCGMKSPLIS